LVFADQDEHREARARFCGDMFDWLANDPAQRRTKGWPASQSSVHFQVDEPEFEQEDFERSADPDLMRAVAPGSRPRSCDLWAENGMTFQCDSRLDRVHVRVPGFATATLSTTFGEVDGGPEPVPSERAGPGTVEIARIGPSRIEALLSRDGVRVRQRIDAVRDGFVVSLENESRIQARMAVSTELTAGPSEGLPGSLALEVGASADGRRLRIACDALELAHGFWYSQSPILRGVRDLSGSASSVRVQREFDLPPGAELRLHCTGSHSAGLPAGFMQGRASLALGAHDEAYDRALRWIVAKAERCPVAVPTACLLGGAEAIAPRLEERLLARVDAEVRAAVDATLFLAAWRGGESLPESLWLALRRVVLVFLAGGAESADRPAWLGCSLLALRSGDAGLARLCSAAAGATPHAGSESGGLHDWKERIAAIDEVGHAAEVDEFLHILMSTVLGARVARERLEVEFLPSHGPLDRFAFAGLALLGHELSGEFAWEAGGRCFRATFLATRMGPETPALEFDLAPLFPSDCENVEVIVDGVPAAPLREPVEGGNRMRMRCRIPDAIELFFRVR